MEFEGWEQRESFWDEWMAEWAARPDAEDVGARFQELCERSRYSDLWERVL